MLGTQHRSHKSLPILHTEFGFANNFIALSPPQTLAARRFSVQGVVTAPFEFVRKRKGWRLGYGGDRDYDTCGGGFDSGLGSCGDSLQAVHGIGSISNKQIFGSRLRPRRRDCQHSLCGSSTSCRKGGGASVS